MPVFNNILAGAAGSGGAADYKIERSLRFNRDDGAYLNRTFAAGGNRKTWTWSGWVKLGKEQTGGSSNRVILFECTDNFSASGNPYGILNIVSGMLGFGEATGGAYTTALFRDHSAWYHIVAAMDTTQSTPADRFKLYVNGVQYAHSGYTFGPSASTAINQGRIQHNIGREELSDQFLADYYLADVHFVDGQALDCTSFGEFDADTGVWNPIKYTHSAKVDYSDNNQITIDPGNYYLNNLDGPNAFNGDGFTYIDARLGSGSNSTSNVIWQPTGGIQGVTKIRVHTNYATHYKINNGSWTSFTSSGSYAEIYNGSAITLDKLEIRRDDCQASDWGHRVTFYEINDVEYQNVGTNSFHLDFSDNSSDGAFGDDRNDPSYSKLGGATTTTTGAGTFYYGHDSNRLFDGNTANQLFGGWVKAGDDSNVIWSPPSGAYSVNSGSGNLRVYAGYYSTIYVNGVSKATGAQGSGTAWVTLNHTGAINSIKVENTVNDNVARIGGIEVNGELLTTKAWTVNNLQAASSGNGNYIANLSSNGTNTYTQDSTNFLKSFDGNLNTQWDLARSNTAADGTLTFPGGYTMQNATTGLRIYMGASWNISGTLYRRYYKINNGSWVMIGDTSDSNADGAPKRWITIPVSGGTLNTLSLKTHSDNGSWGSGWASAVELDGVILTDNLIGTGCDSMVDSPSNYEADSGNNGGNYATFNPLHNGGSMNISNGNLVVNNATSNLWRIQHPTIGAKTGKFYSEFTFTGSTITHIGFGVGPASEGLNSFAGQITGSYTWFLNNGFYTAGGYTDQSGSWGSGCTFSDVYGIAVDLTNSNVSFYKNGTHVGTKSMVNRLDEVYHIFVTIYGGATATANFGQRPFRHTPPTGYKALCTQNLDDPTIKNSNTAFDAHAYDGTGQAKTVSGLKLSPDMAWIKERDGTSWPRIIDDVRGQKEVFPNRNAQQAGFTQGLNQFTSDGFVLGTGADSNVNTNEKDYIAWLWGGGTSFSNSANTNGASVASSGKTNTSAGFAIATFTSPASGNFSIAHGLNQTPEFAMVKTTGAQGDWTIFHKDVMTSTQHYLVLNNSNPLYTYNNIWGSGLPTSSVINMTSAGAVANGHTCVAYSFAPIEGFSAFGKYTGSSGQNFQHLGFQPRWIMIKNTSSSNYTAYTGWAMFDTERQTHNVNLNALWANNSSEEGLRGNGSAATAPNFGIDILSNGFCLRDNGASEINLNNETYVYAAFAEHPFKYARAR